MITSGSGLAVQGIAFSGKTATVNLLNTGTIDGCYTGASGVDTINTSGLMTGATFNLQAGQDLIRNTGTIIGQILLGDGNDRYLGASGHLNGGVLGGAGNDIVLAAGEDDQLNGEAGNDSLSGGDGNDTLISGNGGDRLIGGNGDDLIIGGVATGATLAGDKDVLSGGAGADLFVFRSALELGTGAARDRITDFTHSSDHIDLSGFMGGASFTGAAPFVVNGLGQVHDTALTGVLSGDVNGDGVEDWQLQLTSGLTLTSGDFVF